MDYDINISVKNLNETKYLAKVFSLNFQPDQRVSFRQKHTRDKIFDPFVFSCRF